jgi:two-component system, NtrC family, nitrogen regulation sensor histidine kinase NtrY
LEGPLAAADGSTPGSQVRAAREPRRTFPRATHPGSHPGLTDLDEQGHDEGRFERRVLHYALLGPAPAVAIAFAFLFGSELERRAVWAVATILVLSWIGGALLLRERVVRPIQTLSNLLGALREGDFSIRARGARSDDALGLALLEINDLSETLRHQRVGAQEATALLRGVMAEIDVAVLAFDAGRRLRLVNRAGERLLGRPSARMLGQRAEDFGLEHCLEGMTPRIITTGFPGGAGRWELRRTTFRQDGLPHQLVVLSDLSRALREEERQAWQRLIRVVSHEINNSLTPIHSIAGSLVDLMRQEPPPADQREDLEQGLAVIRARSAALARFMASYARLARLPPPDRQPMDVGVWVRRVASLEQRLPVEIRPGPPVHLEADGDQLDQLLINLVRNAVDASLETAGRVELRWSIRDGDLEVLVLDEGPGISETANLFVPFFTTKPNGSGIGLALSRQIAEAHGGSLILENREYGRGCRAVVNLPIAKEKEEEEE